MEVVGVGAGEVMGLEAFNSVSLDDEDVFTSLKLAGDLEEVFLRNDQTEILEQLRLYDGIADAGFIFKADENKAFGGPWTLSANHISGDGNDLSFAAAGKISGAPDFLELRAK